MRPARWSGATSASPRADLPGRARRDRVVTVARRRGRSGRHLRVGAHAEGRDLRRVLRRRQRRAGRQGHRGPGPSLAAHRRARRRGRRQGRDRGARASTRPTTSRPVRRGWRATWSGWSGRPRPTRSTSGWAELRSRRRARRAAAAATAPGVAVDSRTADAACQVERRAPGAGERGAPGRVAGPAAFVRTRADGFLHSTPEKRWLYRTVLVHVDCEHSMSTLES